MVKLASISTIEGVWHCDPILGLRLITVVQVLPCINKVNTMFFRHTMMRCIMVLNTLLISMEFHGQHILVSNYLRSLRSFKDFPVRVSQILLALISVTTSNNERKNVFPKLIFDLHSLHMNCYFMSGRLWGIEGSYASFLKKYHLHDLPGSRQSQHQIWFNGLVLYSGNTHKYILFYSLDDCKIGILKS